MPTEPNMDRVEKALAETTAEIAADIRDDAEDLVEIAETRVAAAEATAQAITDAALMSEIGKQVETLRMDVISCANQNQQLSMEVTALKSTVADLSSKLPPMMIAPPSMEPEPKRSSIPQPSQDRTELVIPDNPSEAGDAPKGPEKPKKKRFAL